MWNKLSIGFVVILFLVFQKYPYVGCVVSTIFVPDDFWLQQMHTQRSSTLRADFPAASSATHQSSDFSGRSTFWSKSDLQSTLHHLPNTLTTGAMIDDRC